MINLINPQFFKSHAPKALFPLAGFTIIFLIYGLYLGLIASPADYQQGEMVRVMYIHVPSAWMALGVYSFIALCSFIALVWQVKLLYIFAVASAPIGAIFSLVTLLTGMLWGQPMWGTWWVWDARLTSTLILFLFYISYIAMYSSGDSLMRAEKPACVIAIIGFINIPIVKFSVNIWYSLHQPASIIRAQGPAVHPSMLKPLLIMFAGFICYYMLLLILRVITLLANLKTSR